MFVGVLLLGFLSNKKSYIKMCPNPKRSRSIFDVVGSGVNNTLREFGLETGLIEQQVRDRFQRFGKQINLLMLNIFPNLCVIFQLLYSILLTDS